MRRSSAAGLMLSLAACNVSAQLPAFNPDWKETEVPAPPAFRTDRLILLDMPQHVSLKVGVDPATLVITADGLVRYVVVAVSTSGTTNASYEGIRCVSGEVKVYARQSANGQWAPVSDPQWVSLSSGQRSAHASVLARQGVCVGRSSAAQSPAEIVARLKSSARDSSQR